MHQKRSVTGFSKKEMLEKANIKHSTVFNRRFNKVVEFYGLEAEKINPFKKLVDEDSRFEFPLEVVQPLSALLVSIDTNPFFRTNADITKIDAEKIINFYQNLIEEVERFPKYEKIIIKEHPTYLNTLKEIDIMPKLSKKISETIVALEEITLQERGDIMIHVYQKLDEWVFNAFINNNLLNKARSSNLEKLKVYIDDIPNDITIAQSSIKSLDVLIAERIKMWIGLTGEKTEIKENVINSRKRKLELENYIKELTGIQDNDVEGLRGSVEETLIEDLFDGQFETHEQEVDEMITHLKKRTYENKLASNKAEEKFKQWEIADEQGRKKYIDRWRQNRITLLKEQINAFQETLEVLEKDDIYSVQKVEEEMHQLEEYLTFNKGIKDTKRYEDISNLFLGQLVFQDLDR